MKKHLVILTVCLIILGIGLSCQNKHSKKTMYPTYKGLVMAGYQGWFIREKRSDVS